jgi:alpha-L-arabinofuranosidase
VLRIRVCAGGGNVIHGSFAFPYEWKNRFGKKEERKKERKIKTEKEGIA